MPNVMLLDRMYRFLIKVSLAVQYTFHRRQINQFGNVVAVGGYLDTLFWVFGVLFKFGEGEY